MKFAKDQLQLYAITDRSWLKGRSLESVVEAALAGGATMLQLREKTLSDEEMLKEALALKPICARYQVPLIINDRVDIAKRAGADGVHLGQDDQDLDEARAILGPQAIIGVSCHNLNEAKEARHKGADYLGAGAVFSTSSKDDASALDWQELACMTEQIPLPIVAIGGIQTSNVSLLKGKGLAGVAVISAVFAADDICRATAELKIKIEEMMRDD